MRRRTGPLSRGQVARDSDAETSVCGKPAMGGTAERSRRVPHRVLKSHRRAGRERARRVGGDSAFLREVIGVIPAISVDINQCEVVIAEDLSVAFDAVGEIPKRYTVHFALFGIKAI